MLQAAAAEEAQAAATKGHGDEASVHTANYWRKQVRRGVGGGGGRGLWGAGAAARPCLVAAPAVDEWHATKSLQQRIATAPSGEAPLSHTSADPSSAPGPTGLQNAVAAASLQRSGRRGTGVGTALACLHGSFIHLLQARPVFGMP